MITSIDQCIEVQKRRIASGKRGYSKAVRRFVSNISKLAGTTKTYAEIMGNLPVDWEKKKSKDDDKE